MRKSVRATDTEMEKVIAKVGKNGTNLWSETVSATGAYSGCFIYAYPADDLDGDGLNDVIVRKETSEYDIWTEERTYTCTVIAKRGSDGIHFWTAKSDEPIWIAMPYYGYYYYGYGYEAEVYASMLRNETIPTEIGYGAEAYAPMLTNETMPMEMPMNMNITTPMAPMEVPIPPPIPPGYGYYVTYGYDLNGDDVCDTVLGNATSVHAITVLNVTEYFDTGEGTYPSISGTHYGTITPSSDITVSKLYTYPCVGTGGHTEYVHIYGNGIDRSASWTGYGEDWHNITFPTSFTLEAGKTYNYTIRTGSYPQIIHESPFNATGGTITCDKFIDANGREHNDWIPALRLE